MYEFTLDNYQKFIHIGTNLTMNKKLNKAFFLGAFLLTLFLILFFSFRNTLLHWGIGKATDKIKDRSGSVLNIGNASFTGLATISLNSISLIPDQGDTIFQADSLSIRFSIWTLFIATLRIKELHASGIHINVSCTDSLCNYNGFIHEKKETGIAGEKDYSLIIKKMLDKVFNLAPQRADFEQIVFTYKKNNINRTLAINEFHSDENTLSGSIVDLDTKSKWGCSGNFSQTNHSFQLNIFPLEGNNKIPLINELTGITVGFDTLHAALDNYHWSGNILTANGNLFVKELTAFHKKISDDSIKVPLAAFEFHFQAGKTSLEIDSSSKVSLGAIAIKPFIKYTSETSKIYELKIATDPVNARDFFSSLPGGIFDEVRDLTADGSLKFLLNFSLNSSQPENVVFDVSMPKQKFRLRKSGAVDLMKMNGEFIHNVYESGRYIRSFAVGPSNPFFTPYESVSPFFVNAVLTSEDGNFFFHNGFNEDAFRKSIAANFKAGKFVRGGSTISMQLVKNVFLTRKKTVARKAEEALIVWLIESNRLCPKERMLEVYLNIIELGPNVYGIGEASLFYFNKKPSEITLPEGIFLASLLPHPKWFKYSFDTLGNLKPYLADYYRIVSDFMLRKNLITQEEYANLLPNINLTGPAKQLIIPKDTLFDFGEEEIRIKP